MVAEAPASSLCIWCCLVSVASSARPVACRFIQCASHQVFNLVARSLQRLMPLANKLPWDFSSASGPAMANLGGCPGLSRCDDNADVVVGSFPPACPSSRWCFLRCHRQACEVV